MLINNHHNYQISYLVKNKRENHILLNFPVYYTGYWLVLYINKKRLNFGWHLNILPHKLLRPKKFSPYYSNIYIFCNSVQILL